jgi:hypothetical protein
VGLACIAGDLDAAARRVGRELGHRVEHGFARHQRAGGLEQREVVGGGVLEQPAFRGGIRLAPRQRVRLDDRGGDDRVGQRRGVAAAAATHAAVTAGVATAIVAACSKQCDAHPE